MKLPGRALTKEGRKTLTSELGRKRSREKEKTAQGNAIQGRDHQRHERHRV